MSACDFHVGDKVRVRERPGYYAIVTFVRTDGDYAANPRIYLDYHFGRDASGQRVTSSSSLPWRDLQRVDEDDFARVAEGPAY